MAKTKNYLLTPEDFMTRPERTAILSVAQHRAEEDLRYGRLAWPVRYLLVDLALYSGLRVGEMVALTMGDLYLTPPDAHLIVRHGKGNRERTVYVDDPLAEHLRWYLRYRTHTLQETLTPATPLFAGRGGGPCPTITLMKSFKVAARAAGVRPSLSIHRARHTYATYLLHDTGNLRYVQQQLGHTDIRMTQLYSHILPEANGTLARMIRRDPPEPTNNE